MNEAALFPVTGVPDAFLIPYAHFDALNVIDMRVRLIAAGKSTSDEIFLMVNEKVEALEEARAILIRGGDATQIIDNYRKIVAANAARLSA